MTYDNTTGLKPPARSQDRRTIDPHEAERRLRDEPRTLARHETRGEAA